MSSLRRHVGISQAVALIALAVAFWSATLWPSQAAQAVTSQAVVGVRLSQDQQKSAIEIDFQGGFSASPNLLAAPHRLVVDMPETLFAIADLVPAAGGHLASVRYGLVQSGRSRIVFSFTEAFAIDTFIFVPGKTSAEQTLKIVVSKTSEAAFEKALANQMLTTSAVAGGKGDRVIRAEEEAGFNVVIDPGHGGIDSGAVGISGTIEKNVTLAFSRLLAEKLNKFPGIKARLTREDDRFIALDERVRIARQLNAHLLISIHADTIRDKSLRGATVYTLSEKASDEVAHAVAQQENLSDAIGGVAVEIDDQKVADILIDLTRRETKQFSNQFAQVMVESLKHKTRMINNPHRSAGFRVLKAPDVPSVLVELGYLSNPDDEKAVSNTRWQAELADEMAGAIQAYAAKQIAAR